MDEITISMARRIYKGLMRYIVREMGAGKPGLFRLVKVNLYLMALEYIRNHT